MKKCLTSNCEKNFLLSALKIKRRLDGREAYDYRDMKITYGIDRGCCTVQLGNTRVLAQVSCEISTPKQTRPNEGLLFIGVELSPMGAPYFETGRPSDQAIEINRLIERCILESRCVDTESLCIIAGVKVWSVKVTVHVLNHDGNLVDACSIGVIASLLHFKRPDITVSGDDITIHTQEEKDFISLSVHRIPLCITFTFYDQAQYLLIDPTEREEQIMDGKLVIGINKHREICTLQTSGHMLILKDQILRCTNIAVVKCTEITKLIEQALKNDSDARKNGEKFGFAQSIKKNKVTVSSQVEEHSVSNQNRLDNSDSDAPSTESDEDAEFSDCIVVNKMAENTCGLGVNGTFNTRGIGEGGANTWLTNESVNISQTQMEIDAEISALIAQQNVKPVVSESRTPELPKTEVKISEDSEEEETRTLYSELNDSSEKTVKQQKDKSQTQIIDLTKALKVSKKKSKASSKNKK